MGLSLKLELQANNYVLVTNTETQEQIEVTFSFLRRATEDSLFMLRQYKHYELIFEAEKHWNNLKKFQIGKEIEILEEIEIAELQDIENIRNSVKQQIIEKTAASKNVGMKLQPTKKLKDIIGCQQLSNMQTTI